MEYNNKKIADTIAKMTPEERVKYLEKLTAEAKKEMTETENMLKESQQLLEKNKQEMLKQALLQEKKLLQDREERKRLDEQRAELSKLLEKEGKDLEAQVENARLPQSHPIVGLYTQLQQIRYNYQQQDAVVDYARTTVIQDLRKEVIDVLTQYKEIPEEMKELADATYRLTKELLGEHKADMKKYFP
jgi:uncharacterized membrane protein (UPF0182 family)